MRSLCPTTLLAGALLPACIAPATLLPPDALGAGRWALGVRASSVESLSHAGGVNLPGLDLEVRRGWDEHTDISGKLGVAGLTLAVKRSLPVAGGWRLAVAPELGTAYWAIGGRGSGYAALGLPVIAGYCIGDHQPLAAIKAIDAWTFGHHTQRATWRHTIALAAAVGDLWQLSPHWTLLPELAAAIPVRRGAAGMGGGNLADPNTAVVIQLLLGVTYAP